MTATAITRRALAGVAALALAVSLAGTATGPAEAAAGAFPDKNRIDPASVPTGPAPTTLHTEGRSIIDGSDTVVTTLPGRLQILGRASSSYIVLTRNDDGTQTLWRVSPDGSALRLRDLDDRTGEEIRLGTYGYRIAYTRDLPGRPFRTRLFVLRSGDGSVVDSRLLRGHVEVVDFASKVLLTGIQPVRTLWYLANRDEVTVRRGLDLLSADIERKRAVVKVKDQVHGWDGVCLVYAPLPRPGQQLWRSCTDRPLSFSPDGTRMVTTFIGADGPGTGKLQVRVAETNRVLATLRTGGFFVQPYWEGNRSFLVHTWHKGKAAILRVSKDGTVERVSPVVSEDVGEDDLQWSFPPA
jgi:hypothetical protein